ncbi:MAG TPA: ATP-binding protein [Steroidobacteraceae bacterium]|nr:ATP-binding protein [Steroidobacteraceae bacterium]
MLIGFKLRNFRSFSEEQTLSYVMSPDRAHESTHCIRTGVKSVPRLSRAAIIFGPNAGGKTNLINALATLQDLVLHSTALTDGEYAERYTPFQFGAWASRPTEFELDVLLDDIRYRYTLVHDAERVVAERLLVYRTGKSQRWFDRRSDRARTAEVWTPFSPSFNGAREVWRKATRSKALFLTTAAQLDSEQLQPLFRWFERGLEIVLRDDIDDPSRVVPHLRDRHFKGWALRMFRSVGIPVDDLRIAEHELPAAEPATPRIPPIGNPARAATRSPIQFLHSRGRRSPVWLDAAFESAGTHRLLGLLVPLLDAFHNDKLLAIDEFDTSLHPLVARFLIQTLNDPEIVGRGTQLLLTSHDTTLMDLEILRRDEIWLAELGSDEATVLSPVLRAGPRKNEMIGKGYLRGRYGAVPRIRPGLLAAALQPSASPERATKAQRARRGRRS